MTHTLLFPLFHFLLTQTNVEIISLISWCPMQPEEKFAQEDAQQGRKSFRYQKR